MDFTGKNAEALVVLAMIFAVILSAEKIVAVLGPLLRH